MSIREHALKIFIGALVVCGILLALKWLGGGVEFFLGHPVEHCLGSKTCGYSQILTGLASLLLAAVWTLVAAGSCSVLWLIGNSVMKKYRMR